MKNILLVLFIILGLQGFSQNKKQKHIEKLKSGIVEINAYDELDRSNGSATGFIISPTEIITNYHVVKGSVNIEIIDFFGNKYTSNEFSSVDYENDLIILSLPKNVIFKKPTTILKISGKKPSKGDKIFTIGNSKGSKYRISEQAIINNILQKLDNTPNYTYDVSVPVREGASGSPIFNNKNEVISVVTAKGLVFGGNYNFSVDYIDLIRIFDFKNDNIASLKNLEIRKFDYYDENKDYYDHEKKPYKTMLVSNITDGTFDTFFVNGEKNDIIEFDLTIQNDGNKKYDKNGYKDYDIIHNLKLSFDSFRIIKGGYRTLIYTYTFHSRESSKIVTGNVIVALNNINANIEIIDAYLINPIGEKVNININDLNDFSSSINLGIFKGNDLYDIKIIGIVR